MMMILGILAAVVLLGIAVVGAYILLQGDAELDFAVNKRSQAVAVSCDQEKLVFAVEVPFKNVGKQEGTILDAFVRVYLPQEQYDGVQLRSRVNLKTAPREDDYFEAMLVPAGKGGTLVLYFEAAAQKGLSLAQAVKQLPDVDVALYAECRGRRELYTVKKYITLTGAELTQLPEQYFVGK